MLGTTCPRLGRSGGASHSWTFGLSPAGDCLPTTTIEHVFLKILFNSYSNHVKLTKGKNEFELKLLDRIL